MVLHVGREASATCTPSGQAAQSTVPHQSAPIGAPLLTAVNADAGSVPHVQQSFVTSLQSASFVHALYLLRSSTSHFPALQKESIVPGGGTHGGHAPAVAQSSF